MRSKTLLICSPSRSLRGGVETILADLCRKLPVYGWDVLLALGKGSRFNNVEAYRAEYPGLPIVEVDGTKGTRQSRLENLMKLIRKIKPDIVFSARIFDAYEAVALLKQKYRAPRLAIAIRAYEPHYLYDAWCYRSHIDLCATTGKVLTAACIEWSKLDKDRVVNIPGGICPPMVPVKSRSPKKVLRIGYVGRLNQDQKRIFDLEPFLEKLDKVDIAYRLDIVGTGSAEAELVKRLAPWVALNRVSFHGWQRRENLYTKFLPEMDCLLHFAHTEGVPTAPREAMAYGVIPIISQFIGLKAEGQFIHEVNSLVFPVGDVDAAVACIRRLVVEPGLMERLSTMAIHSPSGKYTSSNAIDIWAEAFDRCLKQPVMTGPIPKLHFPSDGRLTRLGLSPWLAQRIRNLIGTRYVHTNPGSEWPTGSGLLTKEMSDSIMRFAQEYEGKNS